MSTTQHINVPQFVLDIIDRQKTILQEAIEQLENARNADRRFGSGGRYLVETWHKIADDVREAREQLEEVRESAKMEGVDPDNLIGELPMIDAPSAELIDEWC